MHATEPRAPAEMLDLSYFQNFTEARLTEIDLQPQAGPVVHNRGEGPREVVMVITDLLRFDLTTLNLDVYQDRAGNLLLGNIDESLHPHDRWVFQAPHKLSDTGTDWFELHHHQSATDGGLDARSALVNNIPRRVEGIRKQMERMSLEKRVGHYWQLHHVAAGIGFPLEPLLRQNNLSAIDRHDLLFHYDVWAARNPEFAELPRDIVRRIHGLATIVEIGKGMRPNHEGVAYHLDVEEHNETVAQP